MVSKSDLQRLNGDGDEPGLVTGGDTESPNGRNLIAAANQIVQIAEKMETYGLAYDDLPDEEQDDLDAAFEDLQHNWSRLANLMAAWTGNDGSVEDDGSTIVSPPDVAASSAAETPDIPADPGPPGE